MGQIVRRKRRGRPSNTDRARRSSHLAPPSPEDRRSSRRRRNVRYNFNIDDYVDDDEFCSDGDDVEVRLREKKKVRLLLFDDDDDDDSDRRVRHAPSSSSEVDEEFDCKRLKKRRVDCEFHEDDEIDEIRQRQSEEDEENEEDEEEEEAGGSDFDCGTESDHPKRVPMPDKKTLELLLDKLQKKDTYGVYAEPVDPDELPDYHDVIKHPMDFGTVRKKLAKGLYSTLKEFESDVFLICTNAMQYNAPDTIYYKQASSIQEQAKLKFQRLRANTDLPEKELKSDHKIMPNFSLPKKQLKKSMAQTTPDPDPVGTETLSGATVKTGEFPNGSSAQTPTRPNSGEVLIAENSSLGDSTLDKDQEPLPGKGFMSKLGRKPSVHDENRRATYNISVEPVTDSDSVLSTFEGESKQFIPVGLHVDHSYARSLARFAATLGPVAWKIASHSIEQALPEGVNFGPGWVGEYEPLPTPVLVPENRTLKEPNFLAHFKITSDVKNRKVSQTPKIHVDVTEANGGFNRGILIKHESPRESRKDPIPIPSPIPSPRTSLFSGSNLMHQNSQSRNFTGPKNMGLPRVELNHPPPLNVSSAADFVVKRPISNGSDIPSKPVSRNGNLASLGSFKHPNNNNDAFAPGRASKPVGLDCNRMVPMDSNMTARHDLQGLTDPVQMMKMVAGNSQHQQSNSTDPNSNNDGFATGRPKPVGLGCNRMVPMDSNMTPRRELQGLGDPVQMMKMVAGDSQHQQSNSTDPNSNNDGYAIGRPSNPVGVGSNRMVPMDSNMTPRRDLQGLGDPVQMMKMLPKNIQCQQNNSNGFGFGLKRDESNNVALTAAQAWMSLGGAATATGGFNKQPLLENRNPHKQQISADSLYNPTRDRPQPQVTRFRGEFNAYQQPLRPVNDGHLQNKTAGFPQMITSADLSRFQVQSGWRGLPPQMQQQFRPKQESRPPDLNIGYQSIGSPVRQSTGMLVDSQQPDLALQL